MMKYAVLIPFVILTWCGGAGVASAQAGAWISKGPEGGFVRSLAVDPLTPNTVYAGTYFGGVFKSTDGGGSWNASNTGLTMVVGPRFGTVLVQSSGV